jgi:predicted nucleotidyltransferase
MDRDAVLERLRAHEAELKAMGVSRLSLFGSVARGEAGPDSDVDLAAEFDPKARITLFELGGLNVHMEELLGVPVDIVAEPTAHPRFQSRIDRDRVHVF